MKRCVLQTLQEWIKGFAQRKLEKQTNKNNHKHDNCEE